ncbi:MULTISPECIES: hypothetical protein [unclassified Streptomyces]|uniref:hypothetical protein n=1 Tax=unclassified Streptomyces TaxID=2593676 RepID=UPI000C27B952|nr:hypothetical protein [Streptomyces sp. CB02959]PJN38076.1 hypothetical protein CG747_24615 [Streptomyces sp. CB02959]
MTDDDSNPVACPFGWHDMSQESATVWTCEQHGATLVVGGLGPPAKVAPRIARPPALVPQQTTFHGRHRRP